MNADIKRALLTEEAPQAVRANRGKKEFHLFDVTVVGRVIEGKLYFKVKGEAEIVEFKGKRFFLCNDASVRTFFDDMGVNRLRNDVEYTYPLNIPLDESEIMEEDAPEQETPDDVHIQFDYKGNEEELPANLYRNKVVCECGNVRWVKNSDLFQVKKCKPCTQQERMAKRRARRKIKESTK